MTFSFDEFELNTAKRTLRRNNVTISLEPQVFALINLLVENHDRVISKDELVEKIWGGRFISDAAIASRISLARAALGDDGKQQRYIKTVHGHGLTFAAQVSQMSNLVLGESIKSTSVQRIRFAQNADGHRLAYALTGAGPPLLRFPAPLTTDLEIEWKNPPERAYVDMLSKAFQLLRFDHVGAGQSERAEPRYDFAAQAADAAAVADAAGFDKFSAFSMTGGALAAIQFAVLYPERLQRLAIIGGYADGRLVRGKPEAEDPLKMLIAEGWQQEDNAFAKAFITSYYPEGPSEEVHSLVRHMQAACPPEIMLGDRDATNKASVANLLSQVRCPTLIIHARGDSVHPLSQAQKLAAGIPNAELVILETSNLLPYPGNKVWTSFTETLTEFLAN
ncbi:winged helix-turn-helix domain-containing protein [Roseovarius rhodophyticola]|uniref:Winged helix-turn-helix domain-containing protein n=1 Tax=Roseovarius rhodophyticola TaxID=3080827 RepID=A0ABZ2TFR6_9RHOB|nr:winged helix-turn-helix domain-containing protein [Roseovarius sp. W115]MDV2928766.1 winged helix-turn-helix domain-containing protein [Roseovarius sp. W115]